MNFSQQQQTACSMIFDWFKTNKQVFTLNGYAGTGKTTIAKYIAENIGASSVVFCAYTGKAAKVLRDKGCPNAGTIHSLLYSFLHYDAYGKPVFGYQPKHSISGAGLIVVDEHSMLSNKIYSDLLATGNKILFLGDPFQLPPIGNDKIKIKEDYFLTDVHRQALDSPILKAATDVRLGKKLAYQDMGDFIYNNSDNVDADLWETVDQVIVGRNETRKQFNDFMREKKGYKKETFCIGDKIICLQNNKRNGLLNGMIGECIGIKDQDSYFTLDFECDGQKWENLQVWKGDILDGFGNYNYQKDGDRFDFAYAITCHKSQGSEFDSVLVYNQPVGQTKKDCARWLYTAITRAKSKLILVDQ